MWSARDGDPQAFAVLLMRHRAVMIAVAAGVLGGGPEVEDVVQDASLVVSRAWAGFGTRRRRGAG